MDIVLDPGHGGTVPCGKSSPFGARGPEGQAEKDVTLRLARLVAGRLGPRVALTRAGDVNPSLEARASCARSGDARVFLSIHANEGPPGARGPETWVHDGAGGRSRALARAVQGALVGLGAPDGGVRQGSLAVLTPDRLGPRTAACLVEVDYLSDRQVARRFGNPEALDRIASAIADGVRAFLRSDGAGYGRADPAARGLDDYFTDSDQLGAYLRDQRAADGRMVSTVDDALAAIQSFRASSAASPWTSLDRGQVADRLEVLVREPRALQQGALNLCGPAAFLHVWAGRDPLGFASFAAQLFDTGAAAAGSLAVRPGSSLVTRDYGAMLPLMGSHVSPQADWMLMGAVRNSNDIFLPWTGDPRQELPGLTRPGEVADWLSGTGLFREVRNEANWATTKGIPHAIDLRLAEGSDVTLLVNVNMFRNAAPEVLWPATTGMAAVAAVRDWILAQFPNHFIVLRSEVVQNVTNGNIEFSAWTWGTVYRFSVPQQDFLDNYYGAIISALR